MGLSHSPSIVSTNLVLCLDAANTRSYSGSGNTWFDVSGRSNNATLVNGPTYSSTLGGYFSCDGTNDYIEVADNSSLDFGANNFTAEYWFRKNDITTGYENIWGVNKWNTGGSTGTNEWALNIGHAYTGSSEAVQFVIESSTTSYIMSVSNFPQLYLWNQVVGVRSGSGLSLFVNGALIGSSTPPGFASNTSVNNAGRTLRISNSALNNYYSQADSSIVRIYRQALTADEVKQNYDATRKRYEYSVPVNTDGLLLNLDAGSLLSYAGSGNSWIDVSRNNNSNILINGPTFGGSGNTGALIFDGTNDYARTGNLIFPDTGPFTVGMLYKLTGVSGRGGIFERYEGGSTYNGVSLGQGGPQGPTGWDFSVASNYDTGLILPFTFPTINVWYYDVGVYNGSNQIKIYRNGSLVNSLIGNTQGNLSANGTRNFWIAVRNLSQYLPCHINHISVYNRVLTSSEIYQNYDSLRTRYGL